MDIRVCYLFVAASFWGFYQAQCTALQSREVMASMASLSSYNEADDVSEDKQENTEDPERNGEEGTFAIWQFRSNSVF